MAVVDQVEMERRVEAVLADRLPQVDLLELTVLRAGGGMLRLVVDHPGGVDHEVCVAVTRALEDAGMLEELGAEVWSPGPEPPLRTPEHFRRAVGRAVRVRAELPGGTRWVTGTLVGAGSSSLRLAAQDGEVEIPFSDVRRAHAYEDVGAEG